MPTASSRSRRALRWIAGLVLGAALVFAAGEALMRWRNPMDPASLPAAMAPAGTAGEAGGEALPVFEKARELSAPNVRGIFRGELHRTDALGFRGPPRERHAPAGTRRVLVTGGSITMGSGVAEAQSYPAATEALLNRDHAPPRWEVINAAIAGADLPVALERLEHGIEGYDPDLYVYAFNLDDIRGPHYQGFPAERTALDVIREAGWPARSSSALIRVATWWWLGLWDEIQQLNRDHYAHTIEVNYFENPKAWRDFQQQLTRLQQIAARDDRCVVMLMLTRLEALDPETHPYQRAYQRAAEAGREHGFRVIETAPRFLGRDEDALRHSPLDPHPNGRGHAVLAETLAEAIADTPAECWRRERATGRS